MQDILIYPVGVSEACKYAAKVLQESKFSLTDHPTPEITHLLLDIPSFTDAGLLSGNRDPEFLLSMLPPTLTVIGGNLFHPCLSEYSKLDLLTQEEYLCKNAAITAHCAIKTALPYLRKTPADCRCAIFGWGRIGKCLCALLNKMGAKVILVIRNPKDRALASALGYCAYSPESFLREVKDLQLLFNTAPGSVIPADKLAHFSSCIKIDLASTPGLWGDDVVSARGLPGKLAPESSGALIAESILNYLKGGMI